MRMNSYLAISICVWVIISELAAASLDWHEWRQYKRNHGKNYGREEDSMRFASFLANKQHVERYNANSTASYKMGLNHMSDWTQEEFQRMVGHERGLHKRRKEGSARNPNISDKFEGLLREPMPDSIDWRKMPNRVGDPKDQGHCNSGWAFVATGILEGQQAKRNFSKLVSLSEQQLIDCTPRNHGCRGGGAIQALNHVIENDGIEGEQDYKYEAANGQCRMDESKFIMTLKHVYSLIIGDELMLGSYVANYGPVGASIHATENLKNYQSGVLDDPDCDPDGINHEVLVVGYGQDSAGLQYWIVKNSWGKKWGEKGYFRVRRGVNMCGIAESSTVADVI